jgi:electron transfer flavoprotein beta subunit
MDTKLHIVVCLKQVPDSAQIRVHPVTNTIMRQGVPSVINPYDLFALEEALRLRDKVGAADVTVLTMGPPMAEDSLRKALAYGADRAVLLTDRQFAGSDTLATTYALSSAIRQIGETWGAPHVVFTGKQTIDGDTAQVGPGIAKRLNYNQLTYVSRIASFEVEAEAGTIMVERRAEGGVQVLTTRLPVLMTMLEDSNEIRRGTMDDALRAAQAEIIKWSAVDAGIPELTKCGLRGSPTVVKKVFAPTPRAEKAQQIPVTGRTWSEMADDMINTIFTRRPSLETDLLARTENF